MIDIHSHILYDIPGDDGARDRSMSLDMLRQAAEAGTRELFATPISTAGASVPPGTSSQNGWHSSNRPRMIPVSPSGSTAGRR